MSSIWYVLSMTGASAAELDTVYADNFYRFAVETDEELEGHREFASIAAKLRLGKKYDIGYKHKEALKYLQSQFPSTLEKYEEIMRDNFDAFRYSTESLIGAINLALETNTRSILPVAYLQLGASGLVRLAHQPFSAVD